jgi:hypothetical protein
MSPKTVLIAAATLAAAGFATLPASAAQKQAQDRQLPFRAQIMFNLVDVNGDGSIDQTEIAALQRAIFAAIDADHDGKISKDEFATAMPHPSAQRLSNFMDRQGPPFGRHHGPRMQQGPGGNQQGGLAPQDFNRGPGQGFGPGGPGPMMFGDDQIGPPDGPDGPMMGASRDFASLDTNGDGVVSEEEFAAGAPQLPVFPQ